MNLYGIDLNHWFHVVGGETENHISLAANTCFFPVTGISENRVAGIQVIFQLVLLGGFVCLFFKSLRTLPEKVCYTCSPYLLGNALQYLRFENRGEYISVSE